MRIRTIKPEFWLHEGLCGCSDFTRLLAIALLNWSDDHGYFMAHSSLLRGSLFPFLDSSKTIPGSLKDLSRVGWIELGTDKQGRPVGRVVNFAKHQRVDKPKPSLIKDLCIFQDASKTHPGTIQDASKEEGNGKEQEEEGNGESPPAHGDGVPEMIKLPWGVSTDMEKAWGEWQDYRLERSKAKGTQRLAWTERAAKTTAKQVSEYIDSHGEWTVIDRINSAISGNWKGLNLEKLETPKRSNPTAPLFPSYQNKGLFS